MRSRVVCGVKFLHEEDVKGEKGGDKEEGARRTRAPSLLKSPRPGQGGGQGGGKEEEGGQEDVGPQSL